MTADQLLDLISQVLYVAIFVVSVVQAVRRPHRAAIDIAFLFGVVSLSVLQTWLLRLLQIEATRPAQVLGGVVIMALPYLLLRLVDDFSVMPRWVLHTAEAGLALAVLGLLLVPPPLPVAIALAMVAYFVVVQAYVAVAFVRQARRTRGVTMRRMQSVAAGAVALALLILLAGIETLAPDTVPFADLVGRLLALASGIAFFLGFAPPRTLRRAWQEPELRAFLGQAARLPRLPDTRSIVAELERGAAASLGAPNASVGLWDDEVGALRFFAFGREWDVQPGHHAAGAAFTLQRPQFAPNTPLDASVEGADRPESNTVAVLAAPITAGDNRLGVLAVYALRAPIFAEDDLELVQLLADQAAVVLESRGLIDEAARVQAREHVARLKDDFLSAAAHDLKTPLTTLVAQAQLMERRALRTPDAPADLHGIQRLVQESKRLNSLVLELLDVSRLEQGRLVGAREPVDLRDVANDVCKRLGSSRHRCRVEAASPVVGHWDPARIQQLLVNLVENAVKYSPNGGDIEVRIAGTSDWAELSVTDRGIGIPPDDFGEIFQRFHRGRNVDDRRFAGMGLGLYICRGIVEQHGGMIWVTSPGPGQGSTFHVTLPIAASDAEATAEQQLTRNRA